MADFILPPELATKFDVQGTSVVSKASDFVVEVGDTKQSDFFPQVKLPRWGNQANFSLRLVSDGVGSARIDGDRIIWESGDISAHFYPYGESKKNDGGFQFDVVFASKPTSNVVDFTVRSKGLVAFWQPPLANLNPDGSTWEMSAYGSRQDRPENVNYSWAFYHDSQIHNEFEAGKAFHIYRLRLIDANGKACWVDDFAVDLAAETARAVLPQDFLETAAYPVTLDPTIGYNTQGASDDDSINTTVMNVFASTAAGDANPGLAHGYIKSGDGSAHNWKVGVYATSGGSPASQLLLSTTVTIPTTTSTSYADRSAAITWTGIGNGTSYAVARNGDSTQAKVAFDTGLQVFFGTPGAGWSFASPFDASPGTVPDVKTSFWVDYTASGTPDGGEWMVRMAPMHGPTVRNVMY